MVYSSLTNQNGEPLTNGDVNSAFLRRALANKQQQVTPPTPGATPTSASTVHLQPSPSRDSQSNSPTQLYRNAGGHMTVHQESPSSLGSHQMPVDLDVNYTATRAAELDCDMDSIISQELTLEGTLDFSAPPPQLAAPYPTPTTATMSMINGALTL